MPLPNAMTGSQRARLKRVWSKTFAAIAMVFAVSIPQLATAQETDDQRVIVEKEDVSVTVIDGKIVVKRNGKVIKEMEVDSLTKDGDAEGGATTSSSRTITRRGSKVQKFSFRNSNDAEGDEVKTTAILVGPEGKQQRMILEGGALDLKGGSREDMVRLLLNVDDNLPKFAIGVSCTEPSDVLATQLNLNGALVVERVVEGSAAEQAGLKIHDIVVEANGQQLSDTEQLVGLVQKIGESDEKLKLKIVRSGEPLVVSIKPAQREASAKDANRMAKLIFESEQDNPLAGNMSNNPLQDLLGGSGGGMLRNLTGGADVVEIRQVLPGMIQERARSQNDDSLEKVSKQIAELSKQIELLREEIRNK